MCCKLFSGGLGYRLYGVLRFVLKNIACPCRTVAARTWSFEEKSANRTHCHSPKHGFFCEPLVGNPDLAWAKLPRVHTYHGGSPTYTQSDRSTGDFWEVYRWEPLHGMGEGGRGWRFVGEGWKGGFGKGGCLTTTTRETATHALARNVSRWVAAGSRGSCGRRCHRCGLGRPAA